jgi:hypothetical protein
MRESAVNQLLEERNGAQLAQEEVNNVAKFLMGLKVLSNSKEANNS